MSAVKPPTGWAGDRSTSPLWKKSDTVLLLRLPVAFGLSWMLAPTAWDRLAARVARGRRDRQPERFERQVRWLDRMLDGRLDEAALEQAVFGQSANFRLRQLQILRAHRPGRWQPPVRLEGAEHVTAALAAGRGAILWVASFVFSTLLTKLTCRAAGLEVSHLSRAYHGYTSSRLGCRLLNPVQRRAEDRYLAERIVIPRNGAPVAAMRQLTQRLRENRVVSITVDSEGTTPLAAPFFAGTLRPANGALKLAASSGAPLLPVVTVRRPDGVFYTIIGSPLPVERGRPEQGAQALARALEPAALAHPDQFFWRTPTILGPEGPFPTS
ncbi:lysophospholipid acyltransferase family protein [Geminicoccaceae bacterium 1502E]|nr:lysophospholipid acyltransferase family protein [Geminicoccaceae bacterium 1502E]